MTHPEVIALVAHLNYYSTDTTKEEHTLTLHRNELQFLEGLIKDKFKKDSFLTDLLNKQYPKGFENLTF